MKSERNILDDRQFPVQDITASSSQGRTGRTIVLMSHFHFIILLKQKPLHSFHENALPTAVTCVNM